MQNHHAEKRTSAAPATVPTAIPEMAPVLSECGTLLTVAGIDVVAMDEVVGDDGPPPPSEAVVA